MSRFVSIAAAAMMVSSAALAQPGGGARSSGSAAPAGEFIEIKTSVTKHKIDLPSGPLAYTATAGQIPLKSATGEEECRMFYVAYTKDGAPIGSRPVTFAFNGGPGSATLWLHIGSLGPYRAPMTDDGSLGAPPYEVVPNMETWLDFTDVVCIDAPATGYSRLTRSDLASRYFGIQPDIAAFTEFIREWLKEHKRWSSPLFIAGESYGGIRGSGLCNSLFSAGIAVNGFISISGTSNYLTLDGMRGNDATFIGFLPTFAATAWYHKKLNPRFKSVESVVAEVQGWLPDYTVALMRSDSMTATEKDKVAQKLSEYTGLSKDLCLGLNLRIPEFTFFGELLRDQRLTVGRLDGRLTGKNELANGRGVGDPSDEAITPTFTASINDYLDRYLKVETQMKYNNYGNVRPWSEPEGSYGETASALARVLLRNPHFRVLYTCGYYDMACPFQATIFTVNHMGLDEETRKRISYAYYPAGHMMYIEKNSRVKFHDDVRDFVNLCLRK